MSGRVGSITTDIIADGLVFNMDAANRASYIGTGTNVNDTVSQTTGSLRGGVGFEDVNFGIFDFDIVYLMSSSFLFLFLALQPEVNLLSLKLQQTMDEGVFLCSLFNRRKPQQHNPMTWYFSTEMFSEGADGALTPEIADHKLSFYTDLIRTGGNL